MEHSSPKRWDRLAAAFIAAAGFAATLLAVWSLAAAADETQPQPRTAIAMQGEPRYAPGFAHADYVDPDAPKGGTLVESELGTFDSVNEFILTGTHAAHIDLIYDPLMARGWNEPFSLYALVAETATMPDDRSWIEFALDPRARFADGTQITADDVIFSFETLKRWGKPNQRHVYAEVAEVRRVNDLHVRFVLGPGHDRETALVLALMPVLPEHAWRGKDFNRPTLDAPLGSGPYRVRSLDPGRSIAYERRPDYWARDLPINIGRFNFDTIRVDYYRDDTVALEAFKAGAVNFRREWDAAKWLTAYDFPAAKDGRVVREALPEHRVDWTRALIFNTRRPLFQDRWVREGLTLAFDFEWMNRALFGGQFHRIESYFPNSELAAQGSPSEAERQILEPFRDQLPPEAFGPAFRAPETDGSGDPGLRPNLRQAMGLLEQAGWTVRDGRLVEAKSGRPFAFEILLQDPHDERVALPYARALRRLGIDAQVRTVDAPQYVGRRAQFDFDMILDKWINTPSPGSEQMVYWGSLAADQHGGRNYAGIRSPVIDALAASVADAGDRAQLLDRVHALDRALTWGYYAIPLYYLGVDDVAYWRPLCHPATTPSWGMVLEAWYADPAGCGERSAAIR